VPKISPSTGIRFPDRPARSKSLYRLRYPGPQVGNRNSQNYVPVLILQSIQYGVVSVVTGLRPGRCKIRIPSGAIKFPFYKMFDLYRGSFPRVRPPGREADYLPPSSFEESMEPYLYSTTFLHAMDRCNFTFPILQASILGPR